MDFFLDKLCSDVIIQLAITNQSLLILNKSQPLVESKLFLRKIGYLILKIENKYQQLVNYIERLNLCPQQALESIFIKFNLMRKRVSDSWGELKQRQEEGVTLQFMAARPPQTQNFIGTLLGIGRGAVGGNSRISVRIG